MLLFWSIGWGLYICALWSNYNADGNVTEIIGYSAIAALDLFLLDINGNILDNIGETINSIDAGLLKGGLITTAICCAFCSFFLIIKLFLYKLLSIYHTSKIKITPEARNHLYFFWGINKKSVILAESIKSEDPRGLIIFIEPFEGEKGDIDGVNNILNHISPSSSLLTKIELDDKTIHLNATGQLDDAARGMALWSSIGLDEVESLLVRLTRTDAKPTTDASGKTESAEKYTNQLHFFFISDNRDKNISHARYIIDCFSVMCEKINKFRLIPKVIFCQTRNDSVTSIIEDSRSNLNLNIEVRIIDEALLAVERIKEDVRFHPVSFLDIERENEMKLGAVRGDFSSLIAGFGETGKGMMRFLYEYGAFLDSASDDNRRSPFSCHVFDTRMNDLYAGFISNRPALKKISGLDIPDSTLPLNFFASSCQSQQFYNLLEAKADVLNYIVVALGDDETNITIAIEILKYIRPRRKKLDNLAILVRAYGDESFSHISTIVARYNMMLANESNGKDIIHIFGLPEEIFRYDIIVDSRFHRQAQNYYKAYSEAYHKTEEGSLYTVESWIERRRNALSKGTLYKIEDLRRKESQDFSNAWHALTKLTIMKRALTSMPYISAETAVLDLISAELFTNQDNIPERLIDNHEISYPSLDIIFGTKAISQLITNIAKTEHLRWIAAHEILGYSYQSERHESELKKRDDIRKHHPCMVDWDALPLLPNNYERFYDYLVVETTLRIHNK